MRKVIVFDMDGTIADFYGVEGWLDDLHASNPRPSEVAKPLVDIAVLNELLGLLKAQGWTICVTSWLANDSSKEFDKLVRIAKRKWLEKYDFPYDEIHLVKYGTTKANCTRHHKGYQVLVDDNADVRKGWNLGHTINANEDILSALAELLEF